MYLPWTDSQKSFLEKLSISEQTWTSFASLLSRYFQSSLLTPHWVDAAIFAVLGLDWKVHGPAAEERRSRRRRAWFGYLPGSLETMQIPRAERDIGCSRGDSRLKETTGSNGKSQPWCLA